MTPTDGAVARVTGESAAQKAIRRSLWLQTHGLFGAYANSRDLAHADDRVARQQALCTELERILEEARNNLEALEAAATPAPGDAVELRPECF